MKTSLDLNLGEAKSLLEAAARKLTDNTPLMRDFGEFLVNSTRQRFVTGTDPDGNAWAPNAPSTLARKKSSRPLWGATGMLRQQISYSASSSTVIWGSNRIQAAVMQFGAAKGAFGTTSRGSPIPWGPIPARPFIGISSDDRSALTLLAQDWLERSLRNGP